VYSQDYEFNEQWVVEAAEMTPGRPEMPEFSRIGSGSHQSFGPLPVGKERAVETTWSAIEIRLGCGQPNPNTEASGIDGVGPRRSWL
jgi:hypothetical protein